MRRSANMSKELLSHIHEDHQTLYDGFQYGSGADTSWRSWLRLHLPLPLPVIHGIYTCSCAVQAWAAAVGKAAVHGVWIPLVFRVVVLVVGIAPTRLPWIGSLPSSHHCILTAPADHWPLHVISWRAVCRSGSLALSATLFVHGRSCQTVCITFSLWVWRCSPAATATLARLVQGFRPITSVSDDGKTVTVGDFTWKTWEECAELRDCIGSALVHLNLVPAHPDDGVRVCGWRVCTAPPVACDGVNCVDILSLWRCWRPAAPRMCRSLPQEVLESCYMWLPDVDVCVCACGCHRHGVVLTRLFACLAFLGAAVQFRLVGLYSKNRYEWVIAEQACNAYGYISVPLYDTLGADAVAFVIGQTSMATLFVEAAATKMVRRPCALSHDVAHWWGAPVR